MECGGNLSVFWVNRGAFFDRCDHLKCLSASEWVQASYGDLGAIPLGHAPWTLSPPLLWSTGLWVLGIFRCPQVADNGPTSLHLQKFSHHR